MLRLLLLFGLLILPRVAPAQDWSGAAVAMQRDLAGGKVPVATYFFPDAPDPANATRALGVAYVHIAGSAGSASIHAGLFVRDPSAGWRLRQLVEGLSGNSPRRPQIGDHGFLVTTSTLGPNDPRCCPSVESRWVIDWATGRATRQ